MLSIISTVGMTVFGPSQTPLNNAVREFEKSDPKDIERIPNGNTFPGEDIYQQALADLKAKKGEFLRKACAEINAIEAIHDVHNVRSGNEYHFLASQTPTGMLAARVLADFCKERYQASMVSVNVIQGLQVQKARSFRLTGLPFLVQTVYRLLDDSKKKRLIAVLNPTGGFKATIPYLTLVGMLRQSDGVEVSCIHETSTELITLAGLPIALDIAAIQEISSLLERCNAEQSTGIDRTALAEGLGLSRQESIENHPLWSLFEPFDSEHYILSGLGNIALEELRTRSKRQKVYLSKQAAERFDSLDQTQKKKFANSFDKLREPDWIEQKRHDEYQNPGGAVAIKPGNVDERLFIYQQDDGSILVAELAFHRPDGSYDREPKRRKDYDAYRLWEDK